MRIIGQWAGNIIAFLFVLCLLLALVYKYVPVYYTPQMLGKTHISRQWRPLSDISGHMVQAVIASEDNFFLIHNGFNSNRFAADSSTLFGSRALRDNKTISRQTADAVFLFSGYSLFHDVLETWFTVLIEFVWGKQRIMEVYLNTKEMGDGVFGAEAVAWKYFQKPASRLSASEAALITTAFPNPKAFDLGNPTSYMLKQQIRTVSLMTKIVPVEMGASTGSSPASQSKETGQSSDE
jgi:monofunctional biosynthetic peptidoglycan transglycosylase